MKPHIFYGVLNWGLGHATRSKVLIDALLRQGFKVTLASDGESLEWLRKEYPRLVVLKYPAYRVRYARFGAQSIKMLGQLPRLATAIKKEQAEVKKFVLQNRLSGIISDNRPGFWHPEIPSVYVTHQLNIRAGIFSAIAGMIHRSYIRRFDQCWVPDYEDHRLSGMLSRYEVAGVQLRFTGPLSRFRGRKNTQVEKYVLAVLSGPEPQRSLFEKKLLKEMRNAAQQFVLVSGKEEKPENVPDNVEWHGRLGSKDLQKLVAEADLVISRSGYSSLMDYAALGKKALLVPTPGQGEQQYLARLHQENGHCYFVQQYHLRLPYDLEEARKFPGIPSPEKAMRLPANLFSLFKGKRKS